MGTPTNIYYAKPELFREVVMGWEFLKGINHPVIERLVKHDLTGYQKVAMTTKTNLSVIFEFYQAEVWSPRGEMREFILEMGLNHTSMSVGDIVEMEGEYYFCDRDGWVKF